MPDSNGGVVRLRHIQNWKTYLPTYILELIIITRLCKKTRRRCRRSRRNLTWTAQASMFVWSWLIISFFLWSWISLILACPTTYNYTGTSGAMQYSVHRTARDTGYWDSNAQILAMGVFRTPRPMCWAVHSCWNSFWMDGLTVATRVLSWGKIPTGRRRERLNKKGRMWIVRTRKIGPLVYSTGWY
jgi:hypothetical protein